MMQRRRPTSRARWVIAAICTWGIMAIITINYILGNISNSHTMRNQLIRTPIGMNAVPHRAAAVMATGNYTTASIPTPAENVTFTEVTLHCKTVCSKLSGGLCVPLDLAVFVYKKNASTSEMTFHAQMSIPTVRVVSRANSSTSSNITKEIEKCDMKEHFPGLELIPRQGSCAIVGNSGILNNSSCGDFIDSHDFVIRANMATIKGYEVDVGHTANLTAINFELLHKYSGAMGHSTKDLKKRAIKDRFLDHFRTLKESILWYPKQLYALKKGRKTLGNGKKYQTIIETMRKNGSSNIRFAFNWRPIHIEREWGLRKVGTLGFDIYAVAKTFCSNITLFGFYPFHKDLDGRDVKHHYFEDVTYNYASNKVHDFVLEHNKLKELEKQGKLKLIVRACKPTINKAFSQSACGMTQNTTEGCNH